MARLSTIGFDADDTLWQNERHFRFTEAMFTDLLRDHAPAEVIGARLLDAERRNLAFYGFGIKGFTLSMIETAIELTEGRVPATTLKRILDAGREMLHHPVELLPGAEATLAALAPHHHLVLITKGDLFDQERKVAQSGLGELFHGIEIVSDKTTDTYARIFSRHGTGAGDAMMVGNSLKSDVVPALQAGAWGVHVPHELTWALEHVEAPSHHARFRVVPDLGGLLPLLDAEGLR